MKKIFRNGLTLLLAVTLLLGTQALPVRADACSHKRYDPTRYERRNSGSEDTDFETWALCSRCGEWYLYCDRETHRDASSWEQVEAYNTTCTTDGYYVIECIYCHQQVTRITDKAYGHSWGSWSTTKKPTCTEAGTEKHVCDECHKEETRSIAALGHKWGSWSRVKEPTCTEAGQEKRTCSVCGSEEKREIAALGHAWGDWRVTKPSGHGTPGEETRTCVRCGQSETRATEAAKALYKEGDSGLLIRIAQQLLRDGGEYGGAVDGVFSGELADAVRTFERAQKLSETGEIFEDTMQLLTSRYVDGFEGDIPTEGAMDLFASGIASEGIFENHCTPNGDGTHQNIPVLIGVRFYYCGEKEELFLPKEKQITFAELTELCRVENEQLTCEKCGWQTEFAVTYASVEHLAAAGSIATLRDLTGGTGLPPLDNLYYDDVFDCLIWDPLKGADHYELQIGTEEPETGEPDAATKERHFSLGGYEDGNYLAAVQACGEDGEPMSDPAYLVFGRYLSQMPPVKNVAIENGTVTWTYPYAEKHPVFTVLIRVQKPGESGPATYLKEVTENLYLDLTAFFAKEGGGFTPGTKIMAAVTAEDKDGVFDGSKEAESELTDWEAPEFYRALTAVNVRSGPGKDYKRIGGLSRGDCVLSYGSRTGEDGTYICIAYDGQKGYVLSTCLAMFSPSFFQVLVDIGDQRSVRVNTRIDGTLDEVDLEQKAKKTGYLIGSVHRASNKAEIGPDDRIELLPGEVLYVEWVEDPNYVFVMAHHTDGKAIVFDDPDIDWTVNRYPVRIGQTFDAMGEYWNPYEDSVYIWTTEPDGAGQTVNRNTKFTAEMTDIYAAVVKNYDVAISADTLAVLPDAFQLIFKEPELKDDPEVLGVLEPDDRIRLIGYYGKPDAPRVSFSYQGEQYAIEPFFCRIHLDRLEKDGYILCRAIERIDPKTFTVTFDAGEGICPVATMTAAEYPGYAYRTVTTLPKPYRGGYLFVGWQTQSGKFFTAGDPVTNNIVLTAVWELAIEYPVKTAVTVPKRVGAGAERPFYKTSPESSEWNYIPSGKFVRVVGEYDGLYQCILDGQKVWMYPWNLCFDYEMKYVHYSVNSLEQYLDENGEIYYLANDMMEYMSKHLMIYPSFPNSSEDLKQYNSIADFRTGAWYCIVGKDYKGAEGDRYCPVVFDTSNKSMYYYTDKGFEKGFGWVAKSKSDRKDYTSRRWRIEFDPMRGYCDTEYIVSPTNSNISLPEAQCPGFEFLGWFTEPFGGKRITKETVFEASTTVYAHYKGVYGDVRVATEYAPIYDRPSTSKGTVIGYVDAGETIAAIKESKKGLFAYTSHNGVTGWVQTRYLVQGQVMKVDLRDYKDMGVRKSPKEKAKSYRDIEHLEEFIVIGESDGYYCVAYPDCDAGFAYVAKIQLYDY